MQDVRQERVAKLELPADVYTYHVIIDIGHHELATSGEQLLTSPRFNKGTGFPMKERKAFGISYCIPYRVNTIYEQCERAYGQLRSRDTPIRKNTFLQSLKDQNWTLYYALLSRHSKELVPIIYTPIQVTCDPINLLTLFKSFRGDAISSYSHLLRRSEGFYLTFHEQDSMEQDRNTGGCDDGGQGCEATCSR